MDQALKARNPQLASATLRKQRFTERQDQRHRELRQQRADRDARVMRYSLSISGSESSRSASPNEARTPDHHIPTDDTLILVPSNDTEADNESYRTSRQQTTPESMDSSLLDRRRSKLLRESAIFTGSLSGSVDFKYEPFTTVTERRTIQEVDPLDITSSSSSDSSVPSDEDEDEEEDDDTDLEDYSPIEVATPIAIRMPMSKPSVVSVNSLSSQSQASSSLSTGRAHTPGVVQMQDPLKSRHRVQASLASIRANNPSGFLAAEAQPMDMGIPSSISVTSIEPLSTRSLTSSSIASEDHLPAKRKGSLPMFTKFTHARVNNIKNMMKTQSISHPPATPYSIQTHHSRASESTMESPELQLSQSRSSSIISHAPQNPYRASLTAPRVRKDPSPERRPKTAHRDSAQISPRSAVGARPQTAHRSSMAGLSAIAYSDTTTPPPPPPPLPALHAATMPPTTPKDGQVPRMSRRKSLSNLAFKFAGLKTATDEATPPPMPAVSKPKNEYRESIIMPTPASRSAGSKTPKSSRKSGMMMYSPFTTSSSRDGPIGLGLRLGSGL